MILITRLVLLNQMQTRRTVSKTALRQKDLGILLVCAIGAFMTFQYHGEIEVRCLGIDFSSVIRIASLRCGRPG